MRQWTLGHLLILLSSCLLFTGVLGPAALLDLAGIGRDKGGDWRAHIRRHTIALLQRASEPDPRQQQGQLSPVSFLHRAPEDASLAKASGGCLNNRSLRVTSCIHQGTQPKASKDRPAKNLHGSVHVHFCMVPPEQKKKSAELSYLLKTPSDTTMCNVVCRSIGLWR